MSEIKRTVVRYGLILVFEYRKVPGSFDVPNVLLSMDTDLTLAYNLCKERFGIQPQNITVVTDLKPKPGIYSPWDPLDVNELKNPRIVRLETPDIGRICREMAQFVENTVRGVREITMKGDEVTHEVFIYISGHGAQIPNPFPTEDNSEELDNALIFTTPDGKTRRYLRDDNIFQILFGQTGVDSRGSMSIPIVGRREMAAPDGSKFFRFFDDLVTFQVTPHAYKRKKYVDATSKYDEHHVAERSPTSGRPISLIDRGLPVTTNMLMIIDTCHSGTMTDFHYLFNPERRKMELTRKPPSSRYAFPFCVCLSAAQDKADAPSTSNGSTFTRHLYNLFRAQVGTVTIAGVHDLIYLNLPTLLRRCRPTITSTLDDPHQLLPLLHRLPIAPKETKMPDFTRPLTTYHRSSKQGQAPQDPYIRRTSSLVDLDDYYGEEQDG